MLGAYREALGRLREHPQLLFAFLLPTLLLVGLRALLYVGGSLSGMSELVEGLAGVLVLYLGMGWYNAAIGSIVPARSKGGPQVPEGPVYLASAIAAAMVAAPLAAFVLLVGLQGPENMGAFGLMGSVLLLLGSLVAAGRSVGLPVEASLSGTWGVRTLKRGNQRAREQGGLGLVFLAFLLLVPLVLVGPLTQTLLPGTWPAYAQLAITLLGLTFVGAWAGMAIAIALSGGAVTIVREFACPQCGATASAQQGQARCECGLEGPFYSGERA